MTNTLLVTSSPRGEASHSTRVARDLARRLTDADPDGHLISHDLAAEAPAHVGTDFAEGLATPPEQRTPAQARIIAESDAVVDEVLSAERIVIATAMINLSITSTLKAWLDRLARAGRTFRYTEDGPEGLVHGKKVYLVIASGGVYSDGPAAAFDHAVPYMRGILAFMGMTDVEVIRVEGVAMGAEAERRALREARERVAIAA